MIHLQKNHVSAGDLLTLTPAELESLPVEQFLLIQDEIANQAAILKKIKLVFDGALEQKFAEVIPVAYKEKREPFGKVAMRAGEFTIEVNTPKKVAYNDEAMAKAEGVIRDQWGHDPAEYMVIKRSITEAAWKAWPSGLREAFEGCRTVSAGKRTIVIKQQETEDGV